MTDEQNTQHNQQNQNVSGDQYNAGRDVNQQGSADVYGTNRGQNVGIITGTVTQNVYDYSPSAPGSAPPPPSLIIGRDGDLQQLKQRIGIAAPDEQAAPVRVLTAMRGWPGVGKTTLASALAHDPDISTHFPDGVLWAALGQQPHLFGELAGWARALGMPDLNQARSIEEVSALLSGALRDKRMLLIVDDVWDSAHLQPFRVGGSGCALLTTTRLPEVARAIAPPDDVYILGVLSEEDALELLSTLAPSVVASNEDASRELVNDLEGLPLALHVAGKLLQEEAELGFGVTDLLRDIREGSALISAQAPSDRIDIANATTPTVAALLHLSTQHLDEHTRDCFALLGSFESKPATFDAPAMQAVWEVDDPKPIVRTLVNRGLLEPIPNTGRFWMHAILVKHADSFLED
jgi:hypothetical protein